MKNHLKGRIDHIFLCHGVVKDQNISAGLSTQDFDKTMLVNVRSNVHLISLALPFFKQNDRT
jgi:NAD(P)-dependent dehydrogenase (short-subunit alcohol dehydrogenase family)